MFIIIIYANQCYISQMLLDAFLAPTGALGDKMSCVCACVCACVCDFMLSNTLKKFCSILMSPGGFQGKHVSM